MRFLLATALLSPSFGCWAATGAESASAECPELRVPAKREWPMKVVDAELVGIRELRLEVDVDGDGRVDALRAEDSSGSSGGLTSLEMALAGAAEPLRIDFFYSFLSPFDITPIPEALGSAGPCALAAAERILFGHPVVDRPDPSLQWLLDSPKRLRWIEGPAVLPGIYTLRDREGSRWVTYGGHVHTYRLPDGNAPRILAEDGGTVLLGTAHGVIVTDVERTRHAWIYVFPGGHKLRWPSVVGARLAGREAVVEVQIRDIREGLSRTDEVRIDLGTGRRLPRSEAGGG